MRVSRWLQITTFTLATTMASLSMAKSVVVGGKNFTEQFILSEITSEILENKGFDVDTRTGMGSVVVRQAQENGQVDLYWEYTGTSLITYNKIDKRLSPKKSYDTVKELDSKIGIITLEI